MEINSEQIERFNRNPLYETVGIKLTGVGEGRAEARLSPSPQVCWPFPQQPHGGMLFTIMDTTMAWAVQSRLETGAAKEGPFTCRAETSHQTRHLAFVRAEVLDARSRLIASGQGTFRIIKFDIE
jgi:acyl-coenzyme A thioesterase PaaI-like protein